MLFICCQLSWTNFLDMPLNSSELRSFDHAHKDSNRTQLSQFIGRIERQSQISLYTKGMTYLAKIEIDLTGFSDLFGGYL